MSRIRANQITNKTADGATTATTGFNVTGVCTATSFSGNGSALTGITQVGGATGVDFNDNIKIRMGTGNDLEIYHDNSNRSGMRFTNPEFRLLGATGSSSITLGQSNSSTELSFGERYAVFNNNGSVDLFYNSTKRIETTNTGAKITGDLSVTGVLTYEDVTNVDSVGIITARDDIKVGSGVTITPAGAGFYAGIVTATSFSGSGASLTGITVTSDAQYNTVSGTDAGRDLTSNSHSNNYFGHVAGEKNDTGDNNCGFGRYSAYSITGGSKNTMLGNETGVACQSGDGNVCIGFQAGYDVTGSNNTLIGHMAAGKSTSSTTDLTSGSNNIFIGHDVKSSTTTVSNEIALGNENINHFRIPGIGVSFTSTAANLNGLNLTGLLREAVIITPGKLSDNTNIDLGDGNVHYFTTQETTTSTPNLRFNSSTSLNNSMDVNESIAVTIITTAAAAGYSAQLTIDGSAVTENWVGGSTPSDGGSSGVDIYTYNIIKTASATFTVIANLTKTS